MRRFPHLEEECRWPTTPHPYGGDANHPRTTGGRQFLTKMKVDIIKAIKQAALEDDSHAWQIMEEAAQQWLDRRRTRPGKN